MVDIQSATAEIIDEEKKMKKEDETTGRKYNVRICYAWRPQIDSYRYSNVYKTRNVGQCPT